MVHFPAHQQALIKNNICIVVLSLVEHNDLYKSEAINKFEYDSIIDLCSLENQEELVPSIGAAWDGKKFNIKPFESWTLGSDLNWHPPVEKPVDDKSYYWDESALFWVEYAPLEGSK